MGRPGTKADNDLPLVRVEQNGALAWVVLDSPENRNALSERLLRELDAALAMASNDPQVRAIVLTGEGPAFCSGVDLAERLHPPRREDGETVISLPQVLTAITTSPRPVLARVNGHVRAGGMGLVAACDMAVASVGATFAFSEVRVGVAPAVISVPALRVMDRRSLARYALTGEKFGAQRAVAAGLLNAAVAEDELDGWVSEIGTALLAAAPSAVASTKALLGELVFSDWEPALARAAQLSQTLFASDDAAEGMTAFLEKRAPSWVPGSS